MNGRRTVLIVEGHDGVRRALAQLLDQAPGLRVSGAVATLDEAVRVARQQAPDLVLCDPTTVLGAPATVADGVGAVTTLVTLGQPVVVFTASLQAGEAAAFWRAGAAAVLLKGRPLATLLWCLHAALATAGQPASVRQPDLSGTEMQRLALVAQGDQREAALGDVLPGGARDDVADNGAEGADAEAEQRESARLPGNGYSRRSADTAHDPDSASSVFALTVLAARPPAGTALSDLRQLLERSSILRAATDNLLQRSRRLHGAAQLACARSAARRAPPVTGASE